MLNAVDSVDNMNPLISDGQQPHPTTAVPGGRKHRLVSAINYSKNP